MGKLNMLLEQMSGVFCCLKGRCLWLFLYRVIFAMFIESDGDVQASGLKQSQHFPSKSDSRPRLSQR